MHRTRRFALAALPLGAAVLLSAAALAAPLDPPVRQTLPNGLKVVVLPRPGSGVVHVQLTVEAGTAAERGAAQRGAAPLVAQMLRFGTSSRSAETFADDLDRLGGSFAASANRENAALGMALLPEDLESGLEILSDAVVNPIFDEQPFDRTRNQAVRELVRLHGDPVSTAEEQLWTMVMPGAPAAREPLGDLASLFALTRESLRSFHRDAYRPDRAVLAIAGDVTPARAVTAATEWFGRWSGRSAIAPAPSLAPPAAGTRIRLIDRPDLRAASVRMGWRVPGRDAPDDLARAVGVSLLDEALATRLARRLPGDPGLGVTLGQLRQTGLLDVRFQVPAESVAVAIERVRRAVRQARDAAPAPARLAELTGQVRAAYPMRFASVASSLAQWIAAETGAGDPAAQIASYPDRLGALDAAAITAALRRDWNLDATSVVVIGPAAKLRGPLARLGTVTEVRLDQPPAETEAPADTLAPPTAADEKLGRERIEKAVAAHGGLDRLKGIRDVVSEARIRLVLQGRELRGELRQIRKEPLKMVYLTSFESFESRQVLNGDRAWSVTANGQLQDADSAGVRALQSGFASDVPHLLLMAADPTTRVSDRGTVRVGNQDLWAIDVTPPRATRRRLYLEPATGRLVAMDQNEEGRSGRLVARRLYRDMRTVDGLLMPFEEERQLDGQTVMQVFVTRLIVNSDVTDDEFQKPASAR